MILRFPLSLLLAGLITFGLYFGMQLLIASGEKAESEDQSFKIIDTRIPPRETDVQRKQQTVERPPEVEAPEPPKLDLRASNVSGGLQTNMNFDFAGSANLSTDINFNAVDRDVQPIMRIEPDFQNIRKPEYIVLEFDVTPAGTVDEDTIEVIQTTSTRLQRPAIRAVKRWKYRPKVVNGKAVAQFGIRVAFNVQPPE